MGNAKTDALVIWLDMLRNVKGKIFFRKKVDSIKRARAQPIARHVEENVHYIYISILFPFLGDPAIFIQLSLH